MHISWKALAIALANLDPVIALIREANTQQKQKERLLKQEWQLGDVASMLEATSGNDTARPQWLEAEYGIKITVLTASLNNNAKLS